MSAEGLKASVEKMEAEGMPEAAIDTFRHYYEQLESGETGMLPEDSIEPVKDVAEFGELPEEDGPLDRAVVLKLNGGSRPGHGDPCTAGWTWGMLAARLERDYRWAFISNPDNLAAVLEPRVLAWIA